MDARFYSLKDQPIQIEKLANDLVNAYLSQGYQAQRIGDQDHFLVQIKKGSSFEAFIGMQASLSLTIQRTSGGMLVTIGQQKWIDKAAAGAVGVFIPVLWPLTITAGVGAIRQASFANQVLAMLDGLVRQLYPDVQVSPAPVANPGF